MIYYFSLFLMIVFTVLAQLLIKKGVVQFQETGSFRETVRLFCSSYIIIGFFLVMIAPVFYIFALRSIELSKAFAFSSANYALVVIASRIFFKENVNTLRWVGVALIVFGLVCFGMA